jgi:protein-tyrosine-phosphatase
MALKLIIFVCVSNTCRSPMCEYLLRDKISTAGLAEQFRVASRSLSEDYEPQGSAPNEQGQLVNANFHA